MSFRDQSERGGVDSNWRAMRRRWRHRGRVTGGYNGLPGPRGSVLGRCRCRGSAAGRAAYWEGSGAPADDAAGRDELPRQLLPWLTLNVPVPSNDRERESETINSLCRCKQLMYQRWLTLRCVNSAPTCSARPHVYRAREPAELGTDGR